MRIYTSYFYQIRFFPPNLIPLSTAIFDPKWYHKPEERYYDKRGVLNGMRAEPFIPGPQLLGLCTGRKNCDGKPQDCDFLKGYYQQLQTLSFQEIMQRFKNLEKQIGKSCDFALIFYETPTNPCSERVMVQKWFREKGYEITEWERNDSNVQIENIA